MTPTRRPVARTPSVFQGSPVAPVSRAHERPGAARVRSVTVRAHAKINLDLRVLGTRPDGFHELRTVFQAVALHDIVECVEREGPFTLECDVAGVPIDGTNLVWRAAEALWRSIRRCGNERARRGRSNADRAIRRVCGCACWTPAVGMNWRCCCATTPRSG